MNTADITLTPALLLRMRNTVSAAIDKYSETVETTLGAPGIMQPFAQALETAIHADLNSLTPAALHKTTLHTAMNDFGDSTCDITPALRTEIKQLQERFVFTTTDKVRMAFVPYTARSSP